ncbi:MAG: prenyltransferase/squalene oxidase repeat-containing protein [Anaerolineales bacterium]
MKSWRAQFRYDPIPPLLASGEEALQYFVRRDLLGERTDPIDRIWELPEARKILKKQRPDGSFAFPAGKSKQGAADYPLIETWKQFRYLVEVYGMTKEQPQAKHAAEFIFSRQTGEGDFRGFLANQYATYYTGALLSLLNQAGYAEDPRVDRGIRWLLGMRQDDGGWTIPLLTHPFSGKAIYRLTSRKAEPVEPDRSKPFSHNWTGMALRAFAAHPRYRKTKEAQAAAGLLADRFFQPDVYSSYQEAEYWVRFQYPFWWNNLVAALDSITRIGLGADDERIGRALQWLIDHQEKDGLWRDTYAKPRGRGKETPKIREARRWISLAVCRVFRRVYD